MARVLWMAMLIGGLVGTGAYGGTVGPNVPLDHWGYDVLEKLAAEGMVDRGVVYARPLDRYAIGRAIADLADTTGDLSEDEYALVRRLRWTLDRGEVNGVFPGDGEGLIRRPFAWVGMTMIRASRAMQRNMDVYERLEFGMGNTFGLEGGLGANVSDRVAVFGSGYTFRTSEGRQSELRSAYVRVSAWGTMMQVGRDELRWGPGYRGDFLLADNAPSFPMVRLDRDVGPVQVSALLGWIRNGSAGALGGWRIVWPYRNRLVVEAGLTSVFEEAGQVLWNLVPGRSNRHANQVGELGVTAYLARGVKLYGVSAGDDLEGKGILERGVPWGGRTGYLIGLYLSDPVGDGKTDFRFELCRLRQGSRDTDWYTHSFGYFHRGYLIGHPVGRKVFRGRREGQRRNERAVFARVSHRPSPETSVTLEYRRDSADDDHPLSYGTASNPNPTREVKEYQSYLYIGILQEIRNRWQIHLAGRFLPMLKTIPHPFIPEAVMEWQEAKDWMYVLCINYHIS